MTARFMRSCGASLMRMEGMVNDDEYKEEEACGGSGIEENGGRLRFSRGDRQELE